MKLGRLPRQYSPRVPHLSAWLGGAVLPPPTVSVDYTVGMPANLGVMNNDQLGCCTCAAFYHALQVWTFNADGVIDTESDSEVLSLYEQACGYNPSNPQSDQGGVEQDVLAYLVNSGAPVTAGV